MISKTEAASIIPEVDTKTYFRELSSRFRIENVYYPGCGDDTTLELEFGLEEIVYLDDESGIDDAEWRHDVRGVKADFNNPPFPPSTFDAVFMQDIHAGNQALSNILESLRPGGILIFSNKDCNYSKGREKNKDLDLIECRQDLRKVELPITHEYLVTFRKAPQLPTQK